MIELCTLDDPAVKAFFGAIDAPIRSYMSSVGEDPTHPHSVRCRASLSSLAVIAYNLYYVKSDALADLA